MRPDADIDACRAGHRRLLVALGPLTDADFRAPSRLPRYSRGHVVAHLTNKATAHIRLFGGPAADEVRHLHPEGYDADRAAEVAAARSAEELRTDLEQSLAGVEAAWDEVGPGQWDHLGIMTAGPRTLAEIVGHHLRNVEVHHVDLDVGYEVADWPPAFVDGELARRLRGLTDRADRADLLAWLLDRAPRPTSAPGSPCSPRSATDQRWIWP